MGLKNSRGGEEPESSSPMAGARKNKTSAGGTLILPKPRSIKVIVLIKFLALL